MGWEVNLTPQEIAGIGWQKVRKGCSRQQNKSKGSMAGTSKGKQFVGLKEGGPVWLELMSKWVSIVKWVQGSQEW